MNNSGPLNENPQRQSLISGLGLVALLFTLLALFLIPLPPGFLDLLLVVNIVLALVLLLRGIFLEDPVSLFSFPSVLLVATLFRLGLNVSSTRLILLGGDSSSDAAGKLIESFGNFVVQGDFVVGAIIFSIIAIVNFLVIAKGSARVAEVSARFMLDSLPGKQLAIDSELRTDAINSEEAAQRRKNLERESQFFGSMDGAMKFVQGDAVAGLFITFINLIGGVSLGISRGLEFPESLQAFGLLTIGDGLVSIIPSLLVSICAGIVVTHVSRPDREEQSQLHPLLQVFADPSSVGIAGTVLVILGLFTALPAIPFLVIGLPALIWSLFRFYRPASKGQALVLGTAALQGNYLGSSTLPSRLPNRDLPLIANQSNALRVFFKSEISPEEQEKLREVWDNTQAKHYKELGVVLPGLDIFQDNQLESGFFRIEFSDSNKIVPYRAGLFCVELAPQQILPFGITVKGVGVSPLDGREISWVSGDRGLEALEHLGCRTFSSLSYVALEAVGLCLDNLDEVLGISQTSSMLDDLRVKHPKLVEEVIDKEVLSLSELNEILGRLLREQFGLKSLKKVLEASLEFRNSSGFDDSSSRSDYIDSLHLFSRKVLSPGILSELSQNGIGSTKEALKIFVVGQGLTEELRSAASVWDSYRDPVPISPNSSREIFGSLEQVFASPIKRGAMPIVVVSSPDIRKLVQALLEEFFDFKRSFLTLAWDEIGSKYKTEAVGVLDL